jgi:hypothetical protein
VSPSNISSDAFELAVAAWLSDLARAEEPLEQLLHEQRWLVESGFLTAIKHGRIAYEVTV